MGGGGSTPRKVTIEEEGGGVVKVSEAVARRLVGKTEYSEKLHHAKEERVTLTPQEKAEEILKQNKYESRIKTLEEQNQKLYKTTTEQFAQAVEEVEKKFLKSTASPICDDLQQQVLQCYNENQKETLNCSKLVKAYSSCVQGQRETILTKKGEECQPCLLAQMARGPCGPRFIEAYDCYLAEKDMEQCGMLYLEMKKCWEKHPDYGYENIVNRAYADSPGDSPVAGKGDSPAASKASNDASKKDASPATSVETPEKSRSTNGVSQQELRRNNVGS